MPTCQPIAVAPGTVTASSGTAIKAGFCPKIAAAPPNPIASVSPMPAPCLYPSTMWGTISTVCMTPSRNQLRARSGFSLYRWRNSRVCSQATSSSYSPVTTADQTISKSEVSAPLFHERLVSSHQDGSWRIPGSTLSNMLPCSACGVAVGSGTGDARRGGRRAGASVSMRSKSDGTCYSP